MNKKIVAVALSLALLTACTAKPKNKSVEAPKELLEVSEKLLKAAGHDVRVIRGEVLISKDKPGLSCTIILAADAKTLQAGVYSILIQDNKVQSINKE